MKVIYVKNASQRDKKFQLQTLIYEKNGKKFVKKSVLCDEALPHLHKMVENYTKLSNSIINPKVKLAKIIDKDERSLTFEFIEGISLAKQFNQLKKTKNGADIFIKEYISLLKSSFKMTTFDSKMISDEFRSIFGDFDYSSLDGEICFEGISNIDLIFSNIIYRNDEVYIIDYEWAFKFSMPINYILYRTSLSNAIKLNQTKFNKLYKNIESYFIERYVCKVSFYKYGMNYNQNKFTIDQKLQEKDRLVRELDQIVQEKDQKIQEKSKMIQERNQEIQINEQKLWEKLQKIHSLVDSNRQLYEIAQSMRIKNRIKKLLRLYKK